MLSRITVDLIWWRVFNDLTSFQFNFLWRTSIAQTLPVNINLRFRHSKNKRNQLKSHKTRLPINKEESSIQHFFGNFCVTGDWIGITPDSRFRSNGVGHGSNINFHVLQDYRRHAEFVNAEAISVRTLYVELFPKNWIELWSVAENSSFLVHVCVWGILGSHVRCERLEISLDSHGFE